MIRTLVFALTFSLLACAPAAAQGFGLGPQLGFQKAEDADEGRLMVGAAARLKPLPLLGVEGSISYRSEDYADGALTVRSWPVMLTGLIYPFPVIYGALGAGWYNTTFDFGSEQLADHTEQQFGWHFGAGAELPLGAAATVTADIRYVFLDYDIERLPQDPPGFGDRDANFFVITAGLLFGL